jgi:sugar lactone lactonase YvrE
MRINFKRQYAAAACCLLLAMPSAWSAVSSKEQKTTQEARTATAAQPKLETVTTFGDDFKLVGIAVAKNGRVFASAPSGGLHGENSLVEVNPKTGQRTPYPDASWNRFKFDTPGRHQRIAVQALWVDRQNHLWALDKSSPKLDRHRFPQKLVEFNLASNKVMREYTFEQTITPKDSLNDVRVDLKHGYAYLTNSANEGGLVVLNLRTGQSRLLLAGDPSTVADPAQHLMFGSKIARRSNGKILVIQSDGIALSPDRKWVYYRPLTDHSYWRIPTTALIDSHLSAHELANAKQYLGRYVLSGGLVMDDRGVLYAGDLEDHSVVSLTPIEKNGSHRLKQAVLVKNKAKLDWADGFAIANGYLYIADSHLNELSIFSNGYPREGRFTIFRVKLRHSH